MKKRTVISTDEILQTLCESVTNVLCKATASTIKYSPMVQKIQRTCLRPDIGCFVLFTGGFSGIVVINFSAHSAIEIYQNYLSSMGIPKEELSTQYTSDDVSNVMGELMNQILGDFTVNIGKQLQISLQQNQPKMLTINQQVTISIGTTLDHPQSRRVSFKTAASNAFYLEMSIDKTEFIQVGDLEQEDEEEIDPDDVIEQQKQGTLQSNTTNIVADDDIDDDFMDSLGI